MTGQNFVKRRSPRQRPKQLKTMRHIMGSNGLALHAWRKLGASMAPARTLLRMIIFRPRAPRLRQFENQTS
jgi:hypothetical protein